jgi:predicted Zn-dependent peptidase
VRETVPLLVFAPVQTDKTGASIQSALADIGSYLTTNGTTPEELRQAVNAQVLSLPGDFETSGALMGALMRNHSLHRPDDYYTRLADRYRALSPADLDQAARQAIDPSKLIWVVVGDAAKVRPQLETLGLPVQVIDAP